MSAEKWRDFSISRHIALTDPPISVQESNVIENYHASRQKYKDGKSEDEEEGRGN